MAKTLIDFRAEKGLYLKDLAEAIGIPEEELRAIEESGKLPAELGQRIIAHYALPADYFAEPIKMQATKKNPSNPLTYFFGVSLVWGIITGFVSTLPSFILQTILSMLSVASNGNFTEEYYPTFLVTGPINAIIGYFPTVVSIVSGVFLVKYLLKHTNYVGNIKKYQFVYPVLPNAPVLCLSMLLGLITQTVLEKSLEATSFEASHNSMFALLGINGITFVVSIGISLLTSFICAKLLYSAVFDDDEKRRKLLRTIAIFATISYVLTAIMYIIRTLTSNDYNLVMMITDIIGYVLGIALAWAIALVKTDNKKVETVVYTVLPILAMIF